ncbi:hypothetical protein C789_2379 [Microcystis aeruginosa FACHB-905 = DIANCHI905]|uniref:Uncharacterized protein n=1 Tax=Microcystis aeruginosa PCC 7806SL TaxID=1903187 RepID=A0AB33C9Q6_MICA7|nr:hypothetical protein BH695_4489 [Microcystis aeruginosa PCC 7806SL]ELS47817.1 hypothetical protein C789_2379 [Microcystis aeruginosa FACHB-905 = DIANCHI905]
MRCEWLLAISDQLVNCSDNFSLITDNYAPTIFIVQLL